MNDIRYQYHLLK